VAPSRELELLVALEAIERELTAFTASLRTAGRYRRDRIERALALVQAVLEPKNVADVAAIEGGETPPTSAKAASRRRKGA
jgi:hypothetical protein